MALGNGVPSAAKPWRSVRPAPQSGQGETLMYGRLKGLVSPAHIWHFGAVDGDAKGSVSPEFDAR